MNITDVRVRLLSSENDRLKAFCSVTLDGEFVIKDIKVIDGPNGTFVAMPSRKLADRCPRCSTKNPLRARYCSQCGKKLPSRRVPIDEGGRPKLHADIAHPITLRCREELQKRLLSAFAAEVEKSKSPDYRPASIYTPDELDLDERPEIQPPTPPPPQREQGRRDFGSGIL